MNDFNIIAGILSNWPNTKLESLELTDNSCKRLIQVLKELKANPTNVGKGDIAGLIGHTLRRKSLVQQEGLTKPRFKVPNDGNWPDKTVWENFGFKVLTPDSESFLLTPTDWTPEWLEGSKEYPPLEDTLKEKNRRINSYILADPCVTESTGFEYYTSPGQQSVIRNIFNSRPGATLLINLPTGSGKSLATWLPSLLNKAEGYTTVVIVPTISLAIDQERQIQQLLNEFDKRFAWFEGLHEEEKKILKRNIVNGTQKIIFLSPESLIGTLSNSIYEIAKKGFLNYFVIDEVHLVSQWGTEFRPAFQAIFGLRKDLLRNCAGVKFRTLLLTATLSKETYTTISSLFGPQERIEVLSAVHLRPEPSYWIYHAKQQTEKIDKIIEIVKFIPRPFLLYTSTKNNAEFWYKLLKSSSQTNMNRIAVFHGSTSSINREKIIQQWKENKIDGIIATSAFGVGMDKDNIRSIIHACIPESVDRYYQEVGRGGRDGKACVSFLIYTDDDFRIAKEIGSTAIISTKLGFSRWQTMFINHKKSVLDDSICIDLRHTPPHLNQESKANISWNMRTLLLMARSKLIELESEPPPFTEKKESETDDDFLIRQNDILNEYFSQWVVRFLGKDHLSKHTWETDVERERKRTYENYQTNNELMKKLLSNKYEISEIFKEIYTLSDINIDLSPACGGCSQCRTKGLPLLDYYLPDIHPISNIFDFSKKPLSLNNQNPLCIVVYTPPKTDRDKKNWQKRILEFIKMIIPQYGVSEISVNSEWLNNKDYRTLYKYTANRFLIHTDINETYEHCTLPVPRITILEPELPVKKINRELLLLNRPFHMLLIHPDTPGFHPERKLIDTYHHTTIDNLLKRIN